ncbi:MAG: hypothetical protein PVH61_09010 [Candidatus Aminicenantes bacterium]|jgi:hypothetical protein
MMKLRYHTQAEPAPDLETLVNYLLQVENVGKSGRFVYRGQTKEYDMPLLPSMYRIFLDPRYDPINHPSTPPGFGERFVRVFLPQKPFEMMEFLFKKYLAPMLDESLYKHPEYLRPFLVKEIDPRWVNELLGLSGVTGVDALQCSNDSGIQRDKGGVIDIFHRTLIRQIAAQMPFGEPYAEFLCQQYGITSGYLDASESIEVAAFFASHEAPFYLKQAKKDSGMGIIYRFDASTGRNKQRSEDPLPYFFGENLFSHFEDEETDIGDIPKNLYDYHATYFTDRRRDFSLLCVPKGALRQSRIGRQKSVMISPALIADNNNKSLIIGVEDLRFRKGVTSFYFCHSEYNVSRHPITRNHLWPFVGDIFKQWFSYYLFQDTTDFGTFIAGELTKIPKRPDLIDPGFRFSKKIYVQGDLFSPFKKDDQDNSSPEISIETLGTRLNGIIESVNELTLGSRSMQVGFENNTFDLGRDRFRSMLLGGLLENEVSFLERIIFSNHREFQSAKPLALVCYATILMEASKIGKINNSDPLDWQNMILTSAYGSDHFLDYENAFSTFFNFVSNVTLVLSKDSNLLQQNLLLANALCYAVDEIMDVQTWSWLKISNLQREEVLKRCKLLHNLLDQLQDV